MNSSIVGKSFKTNSYGEIVVLEDNSAKDVLVEFKDTSNKQTVKRGHLYTGQIKDRLKPSVYGVGYDTGKYGFKKSQNGQKTKALSVWKDMLFRCYSPKAKDCYKDCYVDCKWHDFQEFASWFYERHFEGFELDKDILVNGNRVYSEDTCCLVPRNLNMFKVHTRGKSVIGVVKNSNGTYTSYCNDSYGKTINLGTRSEESEAFNLYKNYKENLARIIARRYKTIEGFDERVYDALMNYTVNDVGEKL